MGFIIGFIKEWGFGVERSGWIEMVEVDPKIMGLGPTPAIRRALNDAGLKLQDMDIIELNEAFAAQSLGVIHELSEEHGMLEDEILRKMNEVHYIHGYYE